MGLSQLLNKTAIDYVGLLCSKVLRCNRVSNGYIQKQIFTNGLPDSISQRMRLFGDWRKHGTVQNLTRHTTSLAHLRNVSRLGEGTRSGDKPESQFDNKRRLVAVAIYLDAF